MNRLQKFIFPLAALYGMLAVIIAAMGSHALGLTSGTSQQLFNNAVIYQLLHSILLLGLCFVRNPGFWVRASLIAFTLGILFFCGGIYLYVLKGKTIFSFVTPVGGSLIVLGWLNLTISGFMSLKSKN